MVGIQAASDIAFVGRDWVQDGARRVLRIRYDPLPTATSNFIFAFTNLLPPEDVASVREIRFALKWDVRRTRT